MPRGKAQKALLGYLILSLIPPALFYGGTQEWSAFASTALVGIYFTFRILRSLWNGKVGISIEPQDFAALGLTFYILLTLFAPFSPPQALDSFVILLCALGYFYMARSISQSGLCLHLCVLLCWLAAGLVGIGFLQLHGYVSHAWWDPPALFAATFVNHNHFASLLLLALPICGGLILTLKREPAQRFLMFLTMAFIAAGLLMTRSRGGWIAMIIVASIASVLWFVANRNSIQKWKLYFSFASFIGFSIFIMTRAGVYKRISTLFDLGNDASFQLRNLIWQGSVPLMGEHTLFGHGLDSYSYVFPLYRPAGLFRFIDFAHSEYLQMIGEVGLVGLVLTLLFFFLLSKKAICTIANSQTLWKKGIASGFIAGLAAVSIHSIADFPFRIPLVLFFLAALSGAISGLPVKTNVVQPIKASIYNPIFRFTLFPLMLAVAVFLLLFLSKMVLGDLSAREAHRLDGDGNLSSSVVHSRDAVRHTPWRAHYQRLLGMRLQDLADQREGEERTTLLLDAVSAFEEALTQTPYDSMAAFELGQAMAQMSRHEEAEFWFSKAVERDPINPTYLKNLGSAELALGETEDAMKHLFKAGKIAKESGHRIDLFGALSSATYFSREGQAAMLAGSPDIARSAFQIALMIDESDEAARVGLGLIEFRAGNEKQAYRLIPPTLKRFQRAVWYAGLGHIAFDRGDYGSAGQMVEIALRLNDKNILANHLRITLAQKSNKATEAEAALNDLLDLNAGPVFLKRDEAGAKKLVWEPEKGTYSFGHKIWNGWNLFTNGVIQDAFALPVGPVQFEVKVKGTLAKNMGPIMRIHWNHQLVFFTEVRSKEWTAYRFQVNVGLGESLLKIGYLNDLNDRVKGRDRNLKIESVSAGWVSA